MSKPGPDREKTLSQQRQASLDELARTYDTHAAGLFGYVRSLGADAALADDVLQEVFLKLARRRGGLLRIRDPRAYIYALARREFYRWSKRWTRRRHIDVASLDSVLEPASGTLDVSQVKCLEEAIAWLPKAQREVVVLKCFSGMSFKEIAAVMETGLSTAASRYRYAIEKLREQLGTD